LQPLAILDNYVVQTAALNPKFFLLISLWVLKNVEFDADFDPVKKITKKFTQKVIGQKRLHKDIKVKKTKFFITMSLITFSKDSKSASNSSFFDTHIEILLKILK
jgi:hypothetical protein